MGTAKLFKYNSACYQHQGSWDVATLLGQCIEIIRSIWSIKLAVVTVIDSQKIQDWAVGWKGLWQVFHCCKMAIYGMLVLYWWLFCECYCKRCQCHLTWQASNWGRKLMGRDWEDWGITGWVRILERGWSANYALWVLSISNLNFSLLWHMLSKEVIHVQWDPGA